MTDTAGNVACGKTRRRCRRFCNRQDRRLFALAIDHGGGHLADRANDVRAGRAHALPFFRKPRDRLCRNACRVAERATDGRRRVADVGDGPLQFVLQFPLSIDHCLLVFHVQAQGFVGCQFAGSKLFVPRCLLGFG